jgi:hypothetical protein
MVWNTQHLLKSEIPLLIYERYPWGFVTVTILICILEISDSFLSHNQLDTGFSALFPSISGLYIYPEWSHCLFLCQTKYIPGKLSKPYGPNYRQRGSELLPKPAEVGHALMTYLNIYLDSVYSSSTMYTNWPISFLYSYSCLVGIFYLPLLPCMFFRFTFGREGICIIHIDMIFEQL